MKLIAIERKESTEQVIINADQICSVFKRGSVVISLADGRQIETKFTDLTSAVEYIQRATIWTFSSRTNIGRET